MGVNGLTTFINNRRDRYYKYYELHDTYLVIDGNSIGCYLYNACSKANCAFGGDYDAYAQSISNFFDNLLKCNVIPLVLLDGGGEIKKLKTRISRVKQNIEKAAHFRPLSQKSTHFFPLLRREVFKDVMREKNIRHVQCLFEADNHIAAVARSLNCPVLSYDSDFYIYGTSYIPFCTLDNYVVQNSTGSTGYIMRCQIYRIEYLLNFFKGLREPMMPLAAILLGNDYVKIKIFKNFFRHLKLRGASRKKFNHQQCRVEAIFVWLSRHTLDEAIIAILSRLIKPIRQRILNIIESNINSYRDTSAEMLVPLGIPHSDATCYVNVAYKFNGNIDTLTYVKEACEEKSDTSTEEETEDIEEINTVEKSVFTLNNTNASLRNLPAWFVNEFVMAIYPTYFMDLIVQGLYIIPTQIDDHCYPSSVMPSLKILSVTVELLKQGINDTVHNVKYITRGQNTKLVWNKLEAADSIFPFKIPSLLDIREIPMIARREILNNTLGILSTDCIDELPPEWMLYIACIKYWIQQQDPSISYKCYLYSLLVCLLFNVIDSKVGKYRVTSHLQTRYSRKISAIKQKRKTDDYRPSYLGNTIIEAYQIINYNDCVLAAPFFTSHFEMDDGLYSNPKKYNKTVVHMFAEFQHCLRHAMNLNALLGQPYQQPTVAYLFHGTLLYNLSNTFKAHVDIEKYINDVFQASPSILAFFTMFLSKVKSLFPLLLLQGETNVCKKPKRRLKPSKSSKNADKSDDDYFTADEDLNELAFHDVNNYFSLLNC